MKNYKSLNCGDINLTASVMAMGVPLHPHDPCSIVKRDNGKDYGRFHILTTSLDGSYQSEHLFKMWKERGKNPDAFCDYHEFNFLMDFVTFGRSQGCSSSRDWFEVAHIFLKDRDELSSCYPLTIKDIQKHVELFPNVLSSYVWAFVDNRDHCLKVSKKFSKIKALASFGDNHVAIDQHLPKHKQIELYKRAKD